ncbi:hypothetical protein AB0E59_31540 [Lentzea sp. NPDC034063]|uniref:hypothetical protein n=1 Tax=unclassified Lentzea TaxID=2643253 RepID=UPI0033E80CD9
MAPVWSALIGALAALIGVWVTQWLTNRREFQRDQLKWAQERQQRQFDLQKTAFTEALTVLNEWHRTLRDVVLWVTFPEEPRPRVIAFSEHMAQANSALTTVELVCSDAADEVTKKALVALTHFHHRAWEAARETEMTRAIGPAWCPGPPVDTTQVQIAMSQLRDVYRAELAGLATEPVALPEKSRGRFRLPWRRSAQASTTATNVTNAPA